ncbi:hypothetical protein GCU60_04100 [Blastococcus saxobsidens]|uniref:Uncharacterized protein n=1 Tax=Blastococcus saxobsidens TaxID=138336 RepID=A0A6L9VYT2_9ACTN|nr:hypothetical protein [Blastococcus saxobsidens]NEK84947.1 hypothetical protein [Blastococcus saxobsidens]
MDGEPRWPSWRRVGAIVPVGAAYVGAGQEALHALVQWNEGWSWPVALLRAGGWAVAMVLVFAAQRAGWFVPEEEAAARAIVRRALATGELPPDGEPAAWRVRLQGEIDAAAQDRWVVPGIGLLLAVLVAAAAVVLGDPLVGLLAAALAGFVVVPVRWSSGRMARAEQLLARVDAL